MNATTTIALPKNIGVFLMCDNAADELRRNAFILYPYIQNKTISHGRAAEILGISKWELINLYGDEGFPYIDISEEEVAQDVNNIMLVLQVAK